VCSAAGSHGRAAGQVGVNDFHLANLGELTTAQFHPDTQRKRIYFSTVSLTRACTRPAHTCMSRINLVRVGHPVLAAAGSVPRSCRSDVA